MEQEVTIEGRTFSLVKIQRSGSAIYRSDSLYLRLGAKGELARDLALHEQMIANGFPVAKIISKGGYKEYLYFIEESLGEKHFGSLFSDDTKNDGNILQRHFEAFLEVTKQFAEAQLRTSWERGSMEEFADGIHLDTICEELPDQALQLKERFSDAIKDVSVFPFVLTHGDFNPHNLYPAGVIDLESSFYGPAGYDLITNLVHINYFPASTDYEFYQGYKFNEAQKTHYLSTIDSIYQAKGLPALSAYIRDFEFCRAIWSAVKIQKYPKLRKFRYDLLRKKFLEV